MEILRNRSSLGAMLLPNHFTKIPSPLQCQVTWTSVSEHWSEGEIWIEIQWV